MPDSKMILALGFVYDKVGLPDLKTILQASYHLFGRYIYIGFYLSFFPMEFSELSKKEQLMSQSYPCLLKNPTNYNQVYSQARMYRIATLII